MRIQIGNYLWGVALIALGILFGGDAIGLWSFTIFFAGWWTLFIIIPCVISIIQNGIKAGNSIGLIIGGILLLSEQNIIDSESVWKLIFPVILVAIGVSIIVKGNGVKSMIAFKAPHKEGLPEYTAIFGGQDYKFTEGKFYGANITAIFGGIDLNLREAIIDEDIQIVATTIFGGADIVVPSNVRVKVICTPIFGGVSNKAMPIYEENAPTIYINSTCIFGGVDVK